MSRRLARALLLGALAAAAAAAAACGGGSDTCESTSTAGPCTGAFACGNSGIQLSCDRATQICVIAPGNVTCETVTEPLGGACPSEAAAAAAAGCTTPFHASCDGDTAAGITVTCEQ